jgi:hypothetical protein
MAKKRRVTTAKTIFEAPIKFGGVSLKQRTATVGGCSISRTVCTLEQADELFTDRRLSGRLVLGRAADANGQTAITEPDMEIKAAFDVKGFRVGVESLGGLSLVMRMDEIELHDIQKLAGKTGRLIVTKSADIPKDTPPPDPKPRPILEQSEAAEWQGIPLTKAMPKLTAGMKKNLADAGIITMGDFANRVADKAEHWPTGLVGIGAAARQKIEDWNEEFWSANPQYSQQVGQSSAMPPR